MQQKRAELQTIFVADCCFMLFCVNKSSTPAAISTIIQISCDRGTLMTGLKVIANKRYIHGKNAAFLVNDNRNTHMNAAVVKILSTVKYPYGR